jgi:hypothetical protein
MKLSIPTRSHTIRFPGDIYDRIHIQADNEGRTFNGQVVWLLQLGYATYARYCNDLKQKMATDITGETVSEGISNEQP